MLKFQQNRTKPALIRIFVSPICQHLRAKGSDGRPKHPKNFEYYTTRGRSFPRVAGGGWWVKLAGEMKHFLKKFIGLSALRTIT